MLGLDRLADYDRMAAVGGEEVQVGWDEAAELVLSSFTDFSPTLGKAAQEFDGRYIDAPVREGKRGGAFCAYTVPSAHPYLMLNYTSRHVTRCPRAGHGLARGAGPTARPARAAHAAHAGRDRVGVRRDARVPASARRQGRPPRAWACWPRTSRARSPPCSARRR